MVKSFRLTEQGFTILKKLQETSEFLSEIDANFTIHKLPHEIESISDICLLTKLGTFDPYMDWTVPEHLQWDENTIENIKSSVEHDLVEYESIINREELKEDIIKHVIEPGSGILLTLKIHDIDTVIEMIDKNGWMVELHETIQKVKSKTLSREEISSNRKLARAYILIAIGYIANPWDSMGPLRNKKQSVRTKRKTE